LPILFPHESDKSRPISEEKLKEELELVIEAAFTDPNDSSAWFYQRWLLGYSEPELDIAAFKLTEKKAILSFTKAVNLNKDDILVESELLPEAVGNSWTSISGYSYDTVWTLTGHFNMSESAVTSISFNSNESGKCQLDLVKCNDSFVGVKMPKFGYEFGKAVLDVLRTQLESCQQLLEYEPDSKCKFASLQSFDKVHKIDAYVIVKYLNFRDSFNGMPTDEVDRSLSISFRNTCIFKET
jgi:geranylgeranyl transferase type-2 subunit alpha